MIFADVQPYCHECVDFSPDVEIPIAYYADFEIINLGGDTIVRCEHRARCERLWKYLEKQMKGEK